MLTWTLKRYLEGIRTGCRKRDPTNALEKSVPPLVHLNRRLSNPKLLSLRVKKASAYGKGFHWVYFTIPLGYNFQEREHSSELGKLDLL